MSKFSNTIEYSLKTTLDSTGITKLQNELRNTENEIRRLHSLELLGSNQTKEAIAQIKTIENALTKAFNPSLGMLDSKKLGEQLKAANLSIQGMYKSFSLAGTQGQMAFNNLIGTFGKVDTGLKSISKTTDKIFNTIGNTVRWGVVASGFQGIMNAAHDAVGYVQELDRSLTDIMMVTEYSKEQMNEYARSANEAAKSLGSTTVAMTDATLVFAQQGFDLPQSSALAERSTKLANASQQQTAVTSDQITAMMNAYGIEDDIAAIDKSLNSWAEVANVSAADVKEIAVGFQKAGSTAATVGLSMDQLNAQIAAIESVTREAPENIGNGLKTLYARFADIGMGETLEDGVDLGQVTKTLNDIGVEVLNAEGKMNNVGDIMEDLMDVWQTLDMTQKNAIATTLAGKYQLSRFEALMNRSDLYEEYKNSSENAEDTLDVMNEKYINSLQGRMNQLQASFEGVVLDVLDTDDFYDIIGALTETINLFDDLIESIGGGGQALLAFGTIATKVFSKNMAAGITNVMQNAKMRNTRESNVAYNQTMLRQLGAQGDFENDPRSKAFLDRVVKSTNNDDVMTVEQLETRNQLIERSVAAENKLLATEEKLTRQVEATNAAYKLVGFEGNVIEKDGDRYNFTELENLEDTLGAEAKISQEFLQFDKTSVGLRDNIIQIGKAAASASDELVNGLQKGDKSVLQTSEYIGKIESEIERLGKLKAPTLLKSQFQKIIDASDNLTAEIGKGAEADEKALQALVEQLQKVAFSANEVIDTVRNGEILTSQQGYSQEKDVQNAQVDADNTARQFDEEIDKIDTQARIQGFIDTTAAIGQMAFAWSSFQSLGSIWTNDDIATTEKINQTILNLSMTVPMMLSSWKQFTDIVKESTVVEGLATAATTLHAEAIEKKAQADLLAAEAKEWDNLATQLGAEADGIGAIEARQLAAAELAAANAARAEAAGVTVAAGATTALSRATNLLLGPLGLVLMALGAVASALVNNYIESINEAKQADYEKAESAREAANAAIDTTKDWEELNRVFQLTGDISDEFKQKTLDVAEQLGVQGASAMAAAEQWHALAQAISEVKESRIEEAIAANNNVLEGQNRKSLLGEEWFNASAKTDAITAYANAKSKIGNLKDAEGNDYLSSIMKSFGDIKEDDIVGLIGRIKENIASLNAEEERLNAIPESDRDQQWTEYAEAVRIAKDEMVELSQQEDILKYDEGLQSNADFAATSEDFQKTLSEAKTIQDLMNAFSEDEEIGKVFNNLTSDAEKYAYILERTNSELAQQIVLEAQLGDKAKQQIEDNIDTKDFKHTNTAERFAKVLSENKDLTYDQKITLIGSIDKDTTEKDIEAVIDQINNGEDFERIKLTLDPQLATENLDNAHRYSSEETEKILEESGLSATGYEDFKNEIQKNAPEINEAIKSNQKAIQELSTQMESMDEGSDEYIKAESKMSKLVDEGERLDKILKQITEATLECQNGLNKLNDITKENFDSLKAGTVTSKEYISTMEKLRPAIAQVLNVQEGDVSSDFIIEHLEDIERLAKGDLEAIDDLRNALGEDLVLKSDIDWASIDMSKDEFITMFSNFQSEIEPLKVGASLDSTEFIQMLNWLLQNTNIKMSQLDDILDTANMDYTVDYVRLPVNSVTYTGSGEVTMKQAPSTITPNRDEIDASMLTHGAMNGTLTPQGEARLDAIVKTAGYVNYPRIRAKKGGSSISTTTTNLTPPSGGQSSKKGGGGGGSKGKGSSYTPKHKDPIKEQVDRYEKVNTQLEDVENTLSRINKEQERTAGFEFGDNLSKQNTLLERQLSLTKQKYAIQKKEAEELRGKLSKDFGVKFDGEGFITNYASTLKKLEGNVNSLIKKYNNATTESAQESLEKKIESAQKKLDNFKELYQRYDTLWGTELRESEEAVEDLKDAIEDLRTTAFKTVIEVVDNIKDLNEQMIEFNRAFKDIKSLDDDNPFDNAADSAERLGYYFDGATDSMVNFYEAAKKKAAENEKEAKKEKATAKKDIKNAKTKEDKRVAQEAYDDAVQKEKNAQVQQKFYDQMKTDAKFGKTGTGYFDMVSYTRKTILEQIKQYEENGTSSIFGENSEALYETAREVMEQSQEMMKDFRDDLLRVKSDIIDMVDDIAERTKEMSEAFDAVTDNLDYYYDMIQKVNGDEAFDDIEGVLDARIHNREAQITALQGALAAMHTELQNATDKDIIKEIEEDIKETEDEIHSLTLENIEDAQEKYELAIKKISKAWETAILNMKPATANGGLENAIPGITKDLDWMETEWELINRNADYYLDDVNAAYETQKLQNKYLALLEEAQGGSLAIQNKISDQMKQQLEYLREKEKLSEYDIAYATAQLEILQKQIALEEAQQNKNQMRLRRDSQGNYRYQYVANENDTKDAENDLLDAQNNAYNLSKEQMKQTQADSLAALQQAKQAILDVWQNGNLTIEERQARTKYILDNLKEYIDGTSEQLQESEKNIINDFIGMAEMLVDENKDRLEDVYQQVIDGNIAAFDKIDTRWSTSLTDWLYNVDEFKSTTDTFYKDLVANGEEYAKQVDQITGQVGEDYDNIASKIKDCVDATDALAAANKKFIAQLQEDAGVVADWNNQLTEYQNKISSLENEMGKYQQEVARLNNIIKEKEAEKASLAATSTSSSPSKSSNSSSGDTKKSDNTFAGTKYSKGALVEGIAGNIWTYGSWGNGSTRLSRLKAKFGAGNGATIYAGVQTLFNGKPAYGYNYNPDKWKSQGYSYYKKFDYSKFDTGGYTGSWNDKTGQDKDGKFALLHQKELVLNSTDTENLLKVIQLVRSITTDLKDQAMNSTSASLGRNVPVGTVPQELEQKVQIDATFPNVKDASEIEQALLGLTDQASQYALRFR